MLGEFLRIQDEVFILLLAHHTFISSSNALNARRMNNFWIFLKLFLSTTQEKKRKMFSSFLLVFFISSFFTWFRVSPPFFLHLFQLLIDNLDLESCSMIRFSSFRCYEHFIKKVSSKVFSTSNIPRISKFGKLFIKFISLKEGLADKGCCGRC